MNLDINMVSDTILNIFSYNIGTYYDHLGQKEVHP